MNWNRRRMIFLQAPDALRFCALPRRTIGDGDFADSPSYALGGFPADSGRFDKRRITRLNYVFHAAISFQQGLRAGRANARKSLQDVQLDFPFSFGALSDAGDRAGRYGSDLSCRIQHQTRGLRRIQRA